MVIHVYFPYSFNTLETTKESNLSIKNKRAESILSAMCPLFRGSIVLAFFVLVQRMTDCQPGKKIYIQADAPRSGRLAVDLYGNDAWELSREGMPGVFRPIHINPRFDQSCVVRNSHNNGRWEQEERGGGMPIRPGERFIVCVTFQSNSFEIAFNGWHFATFRYRTQFTPTTTMILSMIEHVNRIKYT